MENKKAYIKPVLESETFVPQNYCRVCANDGIHREYLFECNAGNKNSKYAVKDSRGRVATISGMYMNGGGGWTGHYYHPCGETHIAPDDSGFLTGYHIDDVSTKKDENISVIIWTDYNRDVHCTTNLDMNEWDTSKS